MGRDIDDMDFDEFDDFPDDMDSDFGESPSGERETASSSVGKALKIL